MENKIEKLISEFTEKALKNSSTYAEAVRYLDKNLPITNIGHATKKEAQERILNIALSKKIF